MIRIAVVFVILFYATPVFSQDYLEKIAQNSCGCLDNSTEEVGSSKFNLQIGLCIIEASLPYAKQLKKDHKIDMDKIDQEGEKLGRLVGIKMLATCPGKLTAMASLVKEKKEGSKEKLSLQGTVANIEKDAFVVFSLKDNMGKTTKLYWLTFVDSDLDLPDSYASMVNKLVEISYSVQDLFDPKLNQYRPFYIISKIEMIDQL